MYSELTDRSGKQVFKRIGADIKIKKCYKLYQIFVALLKFDAFAFLGVRSISLA